MIMYDNVKQCNIDMSGMASSYEPHAVPAEAPRGGGIEIGWTEQSIAQVSWVMMFDLIFRFRFMRLIMISYGWHLHNQCDMGI